MDGLRIVRARVRGSAQTHELAARFARRAEVALSGLDPGAAILCLREAGGVLTDDALAAPLSRAQADWGPIVRQAQARLAAARHPWREAVMPDALAVCFADTAEWLACAALDLLAQRIERCWWWCSLPLHGASGVIAAWQQHPQAVPGALALLAQRGRAVHFAQAVGTQALVLRQALIRHFAVGEFATPAESPASVALEHALSDCAASAPEGVPEATRHWLWLALGLARAPAAVSAAPRPPARWLAALPTREPSDRVAMQIGEAGAPPPLRDQPSVGSARAGQQGVTSEPPVAPIRVHHAIGRTVASILLAANDPLAPPPAEGRPQEQQPALPPRGARQPLLRRGLPAPSPATNRPNSSPPERDGADAAIFATPDVLAVPAPQANMPAAPGVDAGGAGIATEYGGAFHLLNLAVVLGLYPDFTRPADRGLALHPWDFIALLARELIGAAFDTDPLSTWLADAAGRPQDCAAGCWADAPNADWRLPAHWLAPWAAQTRAWRRVEADGRCGLWHPAGFCVADLPADDVVDGAQWPGWVAPRRVRASARVLPGAIRSWGDWAARFAPFVRARLALATGWPQASAADRLLHRPATIRRSAERVVVQMSLAALPIEVRLAGLDRDLGWLPAAGCDLRYCFDAGGAP